MAAELMSQWWALVLLGVVAGVLSGSLGVGSGALLVPALVLLFAVPQKSAQGTALMVMAPMALLGALRYWWNPEIDVSPLVGAVIIGGALVGVLMGTEIAAHVPAAHLRKVFALFLIVVAARMLLVSPKQKTTPDPSPRATPAGAVNPEGESRNDTGN